MRQVLKRGVGNGLLLAGWFLLLMIAPHTGAWLYYATGGEFWLR